MKRSEINRLIDETIEFFKVMKFYLPDFAYFSINDWQKKMPQAEEIIELSLGWDITDFGSDDFYHLGLTLFTIRNGKLNSKKYPKPYAEKIMLVREEQVTPYHYHWSKVEDIINRGGGDLVFKLANSTVDDKLADSIVEVVSDGLKISIKPSEELILKPGQSLSLPQKLYHTFYGRKGDVLVGEVSMVNNDKTDNKFYEQLPRFSTIEEDEKPKFLLCSDYQKFLFGN